MEAIIAAALNAVGLVLVAFIGYYGARKLGIGQNQEKLVSTLRQLIEAQDKKIKDLQEANKEYANRINQLEIEVAELKSLTVAQALRNGELERDLQLYRPHTRRRKAVPEGGE